MDFARCVSLFPVKYRKQTTEKSLLSPSTRQFHGHALGRPAKRAQTPVKGLEKDRVKAV